MATIGQIVDYMNENKIVWCPQNLVEIDYTDKSYEKYKSHAHCIIRGEGEKLYIRFEQKRFIGHFYVCYDEGNSCSGEVLLPLNNKKYLKATYNNMS